MATPESENTSGAPAARVEALRQRLAEDPRSLAFVSLAEELNGLGDHREAATIAQRGLLNHPDSVAGRLALAVAEAEQDHVKEALEQIKRALIIDQENPKALALMGRILLKRGLAKRAVQFLSHAVKLAPTDASYGRLLQQARRQAKADAAPSSPPAVFDADAVPATDDPWEGEAQAGVDHTVFDPEASARMTGKTGLRAAQSLQGGEEPTAFQHPIPKPGDPIAKKAKMGGSAAEYSQMMRREMLPDDSIDAEAEPTVAAAKAPLPSGAAAEGGLPPGPIAPAPGPGSSVRAAPPPVPPADASPPAGATGAEPSRRSVPVSGAEEAGSARPELRSQASPPPAADAAADAPARPVKVAEPKAKKSTDDGAASAADGSSADKRAADKRAADKRVGPAATRMVDDALWALFGKRNGPSVDEAPEPADPGPAKKGPVRAQPRPSADLEPHKPRVVRTSERFGTWARVATLTVLSVAGAFIGHWIMLSSAGPGPEVASEEVKGLASDLERGGLAALLAAEEKANQLARSAPDLAGLLHGVNAEIFARRWRYFGRDPQMREQAQSSLEALKGQRPTVEQVAAQVALSTVAADRGPLLAELTRLEERYPDSPKIRVLQSTLHSRAGQARPALRKLYEAWRLHARHRLTMLELARWYRHAGADAAALRTYEQLLERYPLDVEAAIERYVLGQVTGADPEEAQAVSVLAGLVRTEDPAVAKDETGRAALAFAVPLLAQGRLVDGIAELAKAEAAYPRSADYKMAVAGAYVAVGEFERAEALYAQAVKLTPAAMAPKVGLARARFAQDAGLKVDLTRASEAIAERFKERSDRGAGVARLPYGTVRLVPGRFSLVEFDPEASTFPEEDYGRADDARSLEAINRATLGERALAGDDPASAIEHFTTSIERRPTAAARFGLGRAQLAQGDTAVAIRTLQTALADAPDDVRGRLTTARALVGADRTIEALGVLEPFERSEVVVPEGLYWLGRLRTHRGDYEGAVRPLRTVVEMRPQDIVSRLAYGEVLHRLRRTDDALNTFKAVMALDRKITRDKSLSPTALMYLGRVELERSSRSGVALLKRALKHEDVPVDAHFYLGKALHKSRRTRNSGRRELRRYIRIAERGELRKEAERLLRRR